MNVNLNRRSFLKGAIALAGATAAGLSATDALAEKIRSGVIEGETFYLDETLVINSNNVKIRNCTFIARRPMDCMIDISGARTCIFERCVFKSMN